MKRRQTSSVCFSKCVSLKPLDYEIIVAIIIIYFRRNMCCRQFRGFISDSHRRYCDNSAKISSTGYVKSCPVTFGTDLDSIFFSLYVSLASFFFLDLLLPGRVLIDENPPHFPSFSHLRKDRVHSLQWWRLKKRVEMSPFRMSVLIINFRHVWNEITYKIGNYWKKKKHWTVFFVICHYFEDCERFAK